MYPLLFPPLGNSLALHVASHLDCRAVPVWILTKFNVCGLWKYHMFIWQTDILHLSCSECYKIGGFLFLVQVCHICRWTIFLLFFLIWGCPCCQPIFVGNIVIMAPRLRVSILVSFLSQWLSSIFTSGHLRGLPASSHPSRTVSPKAAIPWVPGTCLTISGGTKCPSLLERLCWKA